MSTGPSHTGVTSAVAKIAAAKAQQIFIAKSPLRHYLDSLYSLCIDYFYELPLRIVLYMF